MKFIVLGGSGLVGSHVLSVASASGHAALGTTRAAASQGLSQLELGDEICAVRLLESAAPDVVIYAAGWTWVDGCESDQSRSRRENFEQPLSIARWCAARGVRMLYYSTSYVFDGTKGNYVEEDSVSPLNVYGRHKADAEKAIMDIFGGSALIARLICVWGVERARKNFAYQVAKAAQSGAKLMLPSDQCGNPTWAGDVGEWSVRLCEQSASGIWHLAGPHSEMSRPDWAARILRGLGSSGRLERVSFELKATADIRAAATRPLLAGMATNKAQRFHRIACREPEDLPADF
jgi:dTDP-4-dehydrorhamnose reductase